MPRHPLSYNAQQALRQGHPAYAHEPPEALLRDLQGYVARHTDPPEHYTLEEIRTSLNMLTRWTRGAQLTAEAAQQSQYAPAARSTGQPAPNVMQPEQPQEPQFPGSFVTDQGEEVYAVHPHAYVRLPVFQFFERY
ncbi:hypothetical protein JCM8547_005896 [Rhodosporidiobolus lusitaniae]